MLGRRSVHSCSNKSLTAALSAKKVVPDLLQFISLKHISTSDQNSIFVTNQVPIRFASLNLPAVKVWTVITGLVQGQFAAEPNQDHLIFNQTRVRLICNQTKPGDSGYFNFQEIQLEELTNPSTIQRWNTWAEKCQQLWTMWLQSKLKYQLKDAHE